MHRVLRRSFPTSRTSDGGWSLLSVPLWVAGALAEGGARWGWWLGALVLDLAGPLVRYWLPGMGRTPSPSGRSIPATSPSGSSCSSSSCWGSIVVTGATATDAGLDVAVVAGLCLAFVTSVALWWLYFGDIAGVAVRRIAHDELPGGRGGTPTRTCTCRP